MKKKLFGRKLSRDSDTRRALFRSIIRELIIHSSIKTTKAKAKAVQGQVDKMIKLAKDGSIAKRRLVYSYLANNRALSERLVKTIAPVFKDRKSGFTRMINLPQRRGDSAKMVRFEWSQEITTADKLKEKSKGVKNKAKSVEKPVTQKSLKSRLSNLKKAESSVKKSE